MADVREMRIFEADQIQVHADLPGILKAYSKEVIRQAPDDVVLFSRVYFENILKAQGYDFTKAKTAHVSEQQVPPPVLHQESAKIENVFKMTDKMVNWNPVRKQALGIHKKSGSERIIIQRKIEHEQREEFRKRFEIVNKFNHRHIQEYFELFEDSKNVYIAAEILKGADLITEFSENRRITEGKCASIIYQILEAIIYLHSKGLAHNNISGQSVQFVAEGSD